MAIAGALVATAPQAANAAVASPAGPAAVAGVVHTTALVSHDQPAATTRTYTVRPGDTLSGISKSFYGTAADWPWLARVNSAVVHDPNLLYVGERLQIPSDPPANAASYTPKHARAVVLTSSATRLSGTLGCSGLEALWESAGGAKSEAFIAAEIAMAESGGQQYAVSPTNDYGYWQINGSHGPSMATFNPYGNARAAIIISNDGTNWGPWTTYVTGAYRGRC